MSFRDFLPLHVNNVNGSILTNQSHPFLELSDARHRQRAKVPNDIGDAAHVAARVNSHDELKSALRDLLRAVGKHCDMNTRSRFEAAIGVAESALIRAGDV